MKSLLSCCIMGIVCITLTAGGRYDLEEDFKDIRELIPFKKFQDAVKVHLKNDSGFTEAVRYFQGQEWAELADELASKKDFANLITYIADNGLDLRQTYSNLVNFVDHLKLPPPTSAQKNLASFIEDVKKEMPENDLLERFALKVSDSEDFKEFFFKMSDHLFKRKVHKVNHLPEMQHIFAELNKMGLDCVHFIEMADHLANWSKALLGMVQNK